MSSLCLHLACIERRIPPAKNAAGGCLAWRTTEDEKAQSPLVIETQRRPGPKDIPYGIPEDQWPMVLARVENHESYRKIAADYGVSRETIRRLVRAAKRVS